MVTLTLPSAEEMQIVQPMVQPELTEEEAVIAAAEGVAVAVPDMKAIADQEFIHPDECEHITAEPDEDGIEDDEPTPDAEKEDWDNEKPIDYEKQINTLSRALAQVDVKVQQCTELLKSLRKEHKELTDQLVNLYANKPESKPEETRQTTPAAVTCEVVLPAIPQVEAAMQDDPVDTGNPSNTVLAATILTQDLSAPDAIPWQLVSVEKLQQHGLSRALVKSIIEKGNCESIGELENLRANEGLNSVQGWGEVTCQKIEDALISWLSANRDQKQLAAARNATPEPATEEEIKRRLAWLEKQGGEYTAEDSDGVWQDGFDARLAGKHYLECNRSCGPLLDDWLRGWMNARNLQERRI